MERFTRLFDNLLVFVYHCFDRIVIHGYLSGLSRPEQVVHFVRHVLGIPVVSKEVLSRAPTTTATGWRPMRAITKFPWNGLRKDSARRITCCPHCAAWRSAALTASTSS